MQVAQAGRPGDPREREQDIFENLSKNCLCGDRLGAGPVWMKICLRKICLSPKKNVCLTQVVLKAADRVGVSLGSFGPPFGPFGPSQL